MVKCVRGGRVAAVLALTLAAGACIPKLREPEVRLEGVRVGGLGFEGGLLYVRLNIVNPNGFALRADGLTYDLDLGDPDREGRWIDLTEGTYEEDLRVEAKDSATVEVPIRFRYSAVGDVIRSVLDSGTLDYRVAGAVAVREPLRTSVPFRKQGTVAVLDR